MFKCVCEMDESEVWAMVRLFEYGCASELFSRVERDRYGEMAQKLRDRFGNHLIAFGNAVKVGQSDWHSDYMLQGLIPKEVVLDKEV